MNASTTTRESGLKSSLVFSRSGLELPGSTIEELKTVNKGDIVVKGKASTEVYNAAIDRWNKVFPKEAGIVVFVESEEDIANSLKFVQEHDLDVAIACGRHTNSGASSTNGGLVIDLKNMRKVSIDRAALTITAQGGCQAKDLEVAADAEGLAVVMGTVNDTGIGGLSLGGGTGFLTSQYGYVVDNILTMRVVLASGDIVEVSKDSNPDLFWAMRGSGSNFGVVSQFTYRVYAQGLVCQGTLIFSPDKLPDILSKFDQLQQLCIKSGGYLALFFVFYLTPGTADPTPICIVFFNGPESKAREYIAPLLALQPVTVDLQMKKMLEVTTPGEGYELPVPYNRVIMCGGHMLPPLNGDVIRDLLKDYVGFMQKYGATVAPTKVLIEIRSHEISSRGLEDMAFSGRAKGAAFVIECQYCDASLDDEILSEVRSMVKKAQDTLDVRNKDKIEGVGRAMLTPNLDRGLHPAEKVYGSILPRLRVLKKKYDPNLVFNKWYPITPA